MHINIPVLLFAALIGVREAGRRDVPPPTIEWGESVNGLSLGLFLTKTEFNLGEPIEITVFIKNDSEEVLHLPGYPAPWYFTIIAMDKDRKLLPQRTPPSAGGGSSTPVQPGKTKAYTLDLNEFLVITNADQFLITVKRFFRDKTGDQSALSRNVSVTVRSKSGKIPEHATAEYSAAPPVRSSMAQNPSTNDSMDSHELPDTNGFTVVQSPSSDFRRFTIGKKFGAGFVIGLLALILAILWRAARRKPEA